MIRSMTGGCCENAFHPIHQTPRLFDASARDASARRSKIAAPCRLAMSRATTKACRASSSLSRPSARRHSPRVDRFPGDKSPLQAHRPWRWRGQGARGRPRAGRPRAAPPPPDRGNIAAPGRRLWRCRFRHRSAAPRRPQRARRARPTLQHQAARTPRQKRNCPRLRCPMRSRVNRLALTAELEAHAGIVKRMGESIRMIERLGKRKPLFGACPRARRIAGKLQRAGAHHMRETPGS